MSEKKDSKRINHIAKNKIKTWCGRLLSKVSAHPWAASRGWKVCERCLEIRYGSKRK